MNFSYTCRTFCTIGVWLLGLRQYDIFCRCTRILRWRSLSARTRIFERMPVSRHNSDSTARPCEKLGRECVVGIIDPFIDTLVLVERRHSENLVGPPVDPHLLLHRAYPGYGDIQVGSVVGVRILLLCTEDTDRLRMPREVLPEVRGGHPCALWAVKNDALGNWDLDRAVHTGHDEDEETEKYDTQRDKTD